MTATKTSQKANHRDLERQRAEVAWQNIKDIKNEKYEGKYRSLVIQMPTFIQVNGLAQTLAFLKAKDQDHHRKAHEVLSNWFQKRFPDNFSTGDLLHQIINMNSQEYRWATREAIAFLQWLKRFAEAELTPEDNN